MSTSGQLINGFVDVLGETNIRILKGIVDIDNEYSDSFKLEIDAYKGTRCKENIIPPTNILSYTPSPVIGKILDNNGVGIPNVKVSFIKDYTINDSAKTISNYNATQGVVDYYVTDNNGQYVVFIENGIYAIRIDGGSSPQIFTGQEIKNGLSNQFYYFINKGFIKNKYIDVIEYVGTNKKLIFGEICDQNKHPLKGVDIIVSQNNEIKTFIKTDVLGKYFFALENGVYDIRIRGIKQSVKIIKNFNFNGNEFMRALSNQSNLFREENGIWICQ